METLIQALKAINDVIWGPGMLILLIGTGLYLTLGLRFYTFRNIFSAFSMLWKGRTSSAGDKGELTPFNALMTALAGTIGTGSIVGVATAVLSGGPGAVLWMWLTGILGMATKYTEVYAAMKYRVKDGNGRMIGGAMYALERGFKHKGLGKFLAVLFALFTAIASFGIGASVQSNSLAGALTSSSIIPGAADIPTWAIGIVVTILVAIVIIGGLKKVSKVCEKLVPIMAIFYVACCLIIIGMNGAYLWDAVVTIVSCAFTGQAAFGGAVGSGIMLALQYGFKRGLFSNESGLGSAPLVAASAISKNPARQALVSMSGTFWDTVVICLITGLMLVTSLLANPDLAAIYNNTLLANSDMSFDAALGIFSGGAALATACFESIPVLGPLVLVVGLLCFTYSTMLGWSQYGDRAITYLFGTKGIRPYQVVFLVFVFWGCIGGGDLVWNLSDISNALMAVPNCIAVLVLSGVIAKGTKYWVYEGRLEEEDPTQIPTVATVDHPTA